MYSRAVVLSGGSGSRMGANVKKQYIELDGEPMITFALRVFQEHARIDEIVLVTAAEETERCRTEIVERCGFDKVKAVVAGGRERHHSVYEGLKARTGTVPDLVFIHDGARPFLTGEVIDALYETAETSGPCVAAVPAKDTIKISDEQGFVKMTPARRHVWIVQTPQVFPYELILDAHRQLMEEEEALLAQGVIITDDCMVAERYYPEKRIRFVRASYDNIKVTTPDDLAFAEQLIMARKRTQ